MREERDRRVSERENYTRRKNWGEKKTKIGVNGIRSIEFGVKGRRKRREKKRWDEKTRRRKKKRKRNFSCENKINLRWKERFSNVSTICVYSVGLMLSLTLYTPHCILYTVHIYCVLLPTTNVVSDFDSFLYFLEMEWKINISSPWASIPIHNICIPFIGTKKVGFSILTFSQQERCSRRRK